MLYCSEEFRLPRMVNRSIGGINPTRHASYRRVDLRIRSIEEGEQILHIVQERSGG